MAGFVDDITNFDEQSLDGKTPPSAKFLDWLHGAASTRDPLDIHHRVGTGESDAAAGNHTHDGRNSLALFDSDEVPIDLLPAATLAEVITAVNAILALLREKAS